MVLQCKFRCVFRRQTALYDDRVSSFFVHSRKRIINFIGFAYRHRQNFDAGAFARKLNMFKERFRERITSVSESAASGHFWGVLGQRRPGRAFDAFQAPFSLDLLSVTASQLSDGFAEFSYRGGALE